MIVYTVALFFQPHFSIPEMSNGHFPVEDTLATAASVASVGLSLPSFAEDGPGMGKAQGMVYDRASEIHLVSCCLCVFFSFGLAQMEKKEMLQAASSLLNRGGAEGSKASSTWMANEAPRGKATANHFPFHKELATGSTNAVVM